MQAMFWRQVFGWVTAAGLVLLFWDLVTIGSKETRRMVVAGESAGATAGAH
jgi:nitric oxide reductase subunit B